MARRMSAIRIQCGFCLDTIQVPLGGEIPSPCLSCGNKGRYRFIQPTGFGKESTASNEWLNSEPVLEEAQRIITGARRTDYGDVYDSFNLIGQLWSPILGSRVTAEQVALCMIQLKIARFTNGQQRDSVVDIAGYAGCLAEIQRRRAREGGLR